MNINFGKCETCEVLKDQLATERTEKNLLLRKLLELTSGQHKQEPEEQEKEVRIPQVIRKVHIPSIRRREMEEQDAELARREAQLRRQEEIEKLEKQVGIIDEVN